MDSFRIYAVTNYADIFNKINNVSKYILESNSTCTYSTIFIKLTPMISFYPNSIKIVE